MNQVKRRYESHEEWNRVERLIDWMEDSVTEWERKLIEVEWESVCEPNGNVMWAMQRSMNWIQSN